MESNPRTGKGKGKGHGKGKDYGGKGSKGKARGSKGSDYGPVWSEGTDSKGSDYGPVWQASGKGSGSGYGSGSGKGSGSGYGSSSGKGKYAPKGAGYGSSSGKGSSKSGFIDEDTSTMQSLRTRVRNFGGKVGDHHTIQHTPPQAEPKGGKVGGKIEPDVGSIGKGAEPQSEGAVKGSVSKANPENQWLSSMTSTFASVLQDETGETSKGTYGKAKGKRSSNPDFGP